jgi:hypothetical protein
MKDLSSSLRLDRLCEPHNLVSIGSVVKWLKAEGAQSFPSGALG